MTQTAIIFTDDWRYRTRERLKEIMGKDEFRNFSVSFSDSFSSPVEYETEEQIQKLEQKSEELKKKPLGKFRLYWFMFWRHFPRTVAYVNIKSNEIYLSYEKMSDDILVRDFAEKIRKEFNCHVELHFAPERESTASANDII